MYTYLQITVYSIKKRKERQLSWKDSLLWQSHVLIPFALGAPVVPNAKGLEGSQHPPGWHMQQRALPRLHPESDQWQTSGLHILTEFQVQFRHSMCLLTWIARNPQKILHAHFGVRILPSSVRSWHSSSCSNPPNRWFQQRTEHIHLSDEKEPQHPSQELETC